MRHILPVLALTLSAGLLTAPLSSTEAETVTITPDNQQDWAFFPEGNTGYGAGALVNGPGTPPIGQGSALLTVDSQGRYAIGTDTYNGTTLQSLTSLNYETFNLTSGDQAVSLQFDVDYNLEDENTAYQGRLVYEPYQNGEVKQGEWQQWQALNADARWWASRTGADGSNGQCPQSNPCTSTQILEAFPNIGIHNSIGGLLLRAGGPWDGGFSGAVDRIEIGVNDQEATVVDFESGLETTPTPSMTPSATPSATASATPSASPSATPTDTEAVSPESCRNGGWQDFSNPSFASEDECLTYAAEQQVRTSIWDRLFQRLGELLNFNRN